MVWTEITRRHYRREGLRYESDTTDAVGLNYSIALKGRCDRRILCLLQSVTIGQTMAPR
jgi:hypothetical protein